MHGLIAPASTARMDMSPSLWAGTNEGGGPCGGPCCPGAVDGGPNGGVPGLPGGPNGGASGLPGALNGGTKRLGVPGDCLKNLSIGNCDWYLSSGIMF
ncbi:MAG TPA: hypothetical protein VFD00_02430, partial [Thermoclostridium sp.]|nr:hypothetical protein [Thermoclostridium sp.]